MDELTLEAVTHHNEGSQLSGENLAVEIEPLNFRPPRVELPDGCLRVLPLGQVVQLAECLVELTFSGIAGLLLCCFFVQIVLEPVSLSHTTFVMFTSS